MLNLSASAAKNLKWVAASVWFAAWLCHPAAASAKIINVQSLAGKPIEQGLSGRVGLSTNIRSGNVQLALASANTQVFYRIDENIFVLSANGSYGLKGSLGKWSDEPFRERLFEHLRFRRDLTESIGVEAFVQHEYDRWRRLKLRALAGVGVRFDVDTSKDSHLAVGFAYMAQWEELLKPIEGDLTGIYLEHRLSSYITGSVKLGKRAAVTMTCYVQPNLTLWSDIRGLIEGRLTVSLTDSLALAVTGWSAWDTAPPQNVRGYDINTTVGFTYAF
ncbi:MAG TPA: hypothetical protein DCQ06_02585 [Myxococcales bacterium]|nr:hypothetical protein [Myxococcales bacterium]HAN30461.1 hypothetical protein [Myxococcales bacterium]